MKVSLFCRNLDCYYRQSYKVASDVEEGFLASDCSSIVIFGLGFYRN